MSRRSCRRAPPCSRCPPPCAPSRYHPEGGREGRLVVPAHHEVLMVAAVALCVVCQDKYQQKVYLQQHGIPLPDFRDVPDLSAAYEAGRV